MSDYDVVLKRGDTRHAIRAVLKDAAGNPVDLTDCSVAFSMASLGWSTVIDRAVYVRDAKAGEVWVVWAPGETSVSGVYRAEFSVQYPDNRKETFPNDGYLSIKIMKDLRKGE